MKKKMVYIKPTVNVTQVVLEQEMMVVISAVNPEGIQVNDWEPGATQAEYEGDIWIPI